MRHDQLSTWANRAELLLGQVRHDVLEAVADGEPHDAQLDPVLGESSAGKSNAASSILR